MLTIEQSIFGTYLLHLEYVYAPGEAVLPDQEQQMTNLLSFVAADWPYESDGVASHMELADAASMVAWLTANAEQLRAVGFSIQQALDKPYYVGTVTIRDNYTDARGQLHEQQELLLRDGVSVPLQDVLDAISRGATEFLLPTGDTLIIPIQQIMDYVNPSSL